MAGYRRPLLRLKFADPEMSGLEVLSQRISMGDLAHFSRIGDLRDVDLRDAYLEELHERLAHRIQSWNLETPDGQPVPTTADAIADQDKDLIMGIVDALMDTADVPAPLGQPSANGSRSVEASMPMETLSVSLPS
jgi:hypothetical protein